MARKKPAAKARKAATRKNAKLSGNQSKGRLIASVADIESLPQIPVGQRACDFPEPPLPDVLMDDIRSHEREQQEFSSFARFNSILAEIGKELAPSYCPGAAGVDLWHLADAVAAEGIMSADEFMSLPITEIPKRLRNAGKIRTDKLDEIANRIAAALPPEKSQPGFSERDCVGPFYKMQLKLKFKVSLTTITRWIKSGEIRTIRKGRRGYMVHKDDMPRESEVSITPQN
jgi:hypothetical protein